MLLHPKPLLLLQRAATTVGKIPDGWLHGGALVPQDHLGTPLLESCGSEAVTTRWAYRSAVHIDKPRLNRVTSLRCAPVEAGCAAAAAAAAAAALPRPAGCDSDRCCMRRAALADCCRASTSGGLRGAACMRPLAEIPRCSGGPPPECITCCSCQRRSV